MNKKIIFIFILILGIFLINDISAIMTYANVSDGFELPAEILGPFGLTTNITGTAATDFWFSDNNGNAIIHTDKSGNNRSYGGFSLSTAGVSNLLDMDANSTNIFAYDSTDSAIYNINLFTGANISTGGFSMAGSGFGGTGGFCGDGVDFYIYDNTDKFVYHFRNGINQSDGFSVTSLGMTGGTYIGLACHSTGLFIFDQTDQFVYHTTKTGVNQTDGFPTSLFASTATIYSMKSNNTDLFFMDAVSRFVNHIKISGVPSSGTVGLNSPINYYNTTGNSINFNCSTSDFINNINNITIYIDDKLNFTKAGTGTTSLELYKNINLSMDYHNWSCSIRDNSSTQVNSTMNNLNITKFLFNSVTYNLNTTEGSIESFSVNISKNFAYSISSVEIIYNGTGYSAGFSTANEQIISKNITIPSITSSTNLTFNWQINLTDYTNYTSNLYNQSVFKLGFDDCSVFTNQLFNITLRDEETQSQLSGGPQNTSLKINFNLYNNLGTTLLINYSNNFTYINPVRICLQTALSNSSLYKLTGVMEYSSLNRFTEFYHFQSYSLNSSSHYTNISLLNLNSSKGQIFKITYKDSNFIPVIGAIMQIQRKYIDEGLFKVTEIPKTGTEGYTIGHLVANDIIYNILVLKDGVLLASFNDIVANCQNPLLQDCNINLNSYSSSFLPKDFSTSNDIIFTLTFNKTTREISSIVSIPSGIPSTILLNATLFDNLGDTQVCSQNFYSTGGSLSCIVPASFGNSTIVTSLYKDGVLVGQSIISLGQNPSELYGSNIIFIALFAFFIIIGIAITDNPMIYGIVFVLGVILMIGLNIVYTPSIIGVGATILWLVVTIVLILIKGSDRQG